MTLAAYYYPASKHQRSRTGFAATLELHAIEDGRRQILRMIPCAHKREARQLAANHDAKPWNF